jgi:tetratricopeptide (TPR) repeat protein
LITIRDIDRLLNDLERFAPGAAEGDAAGRTAMIKGLLQGTDWIDPARAIAAGLTYDGAVSRWSILVPFRTPNEGFQNAYAATAGEDYYLLSFPPDPAYTVNDALLARLRQASGSAPAANLVLEAAARALLEQAEPQIAAMLGSLETSAPQASGPQTMTGPEARVMVDELLKTLRQVETLRLGLDLKEDAMTILADVEATSGTFLSGLLNDAQSPMRLGIYQPDYPLEFRTRAYNVNGLMQMLGASFGSLYRRMGFDFDELAELTKSFTGEMAGGMAFGKAGLQFETLSVLHPGIDGAGFLESVYLPWFERYNRRMAETLQARSGRQVAPLYERTPDTMVGGQRVLGVRTRFSALAPSGEPMAAPWLGEAQSYETRLAAMEDLVLMASDDARMGDLIAAAASLKPVPAQGPLASLDMDLAAYIQGLRQAMPPTRGALPATGDLGRMVVQADLNNGKASSRTTFRLNDLQQLAAVFATVAAQSAAAAGKADGSSADGPAASQQAAASNQVDYWMDRGGLYSTYGSYKAAVSAYQKVLKLKPDLAEAHFQMGVAYVELGAYEAALKAIDRAIDLDPTRGAYFYGRGRAYLLAGDEAQAMRDFTEAGFLGNPDAIAVLKKAGVRLK